MKTPAPVAPPVSDYVSRADAVRLLGIKPATLYTYVSRGWIRRMVDPGQRRSLYSREDVERIKARSGARAADGMVAAGAMRYGEPIIPTSVTEITADGPRYRNRMALDLARAATPFEATAELLWTGRLADEPRRWRLDPLPRAFLRLTRGFGSEATTPDIHDLFAIAGLSLGMTKGRPAERATDSAAHLADAIQLLQALTGCFGVIADGRAYRAPLQGESIAEAIARSLGLAPEPATLSTLNAALTLSADHELNPATFVARIAASGEVDLHSCIAAAVCTISGAQIARRCDRIETLLREKSDARQLAAQFDAEAPSNAARLGFGHPMYPQGDPRGRLLLQITKAQLAPTPDLARIHGFIDIAARRHKLLPRIELALATLAIALGLPPGSSAGLYTFGRIAGWVAHMDEQRLAGFIIRPRARYSSHATA